MAKQIAVCLTCREVREDGGGDPERWMYNPSILRWEHWHNAGEYDQETSGYHKAVVIDDQRGEVNRLAREMKNGLR